MRCSDKMSANNTIPISCLFVHTAVAFGAKRKRMDAGRPVVAPRGSRPPHEQTRPGLSGQDDMLPGPGPPSYSAFNPPHTWRAPCPFSQWQDRRWRRLRPVEPHHQIDRFRLGQPARNADRPRFAYNRKLLGLPALRTHGALHTHNNTQLRVRNRHA